MDMPKSQEKLESGLFLCSGQVKSARSCGAISQRKRRSLSGTCIGPRARKRRGGEVNR